jgi:hypothetical protein
MRMFFAMRIQKTEENGSRVRSRHECRDRPPHQRAEDGGLRMENRFQKSKNNKTNPINFRFSICDLRASWSIAQASSFGVPKTKRGHIKTCNFAKRSQIPRKLAFHSSCCEAGNCESFLVIFPKGNFEKRSQFIHLRFPIADLRLRRAAAGHLFRAMAAKNPK